MKRIFIDVDDVVCTNHIVPLVAKFLNKPIKESDFDCAFVSRTMFPDKKERRKFNEFYLQYDSYQFSRLKPHAFEVLKRLCKKHQVFLLSSCCHYEMQLEFGRQFLDKWQFVLTKLPFFPPQNIIFAHDKTIFCGDVLVDDRLYNLEGDNFKTKILFSSFHNKNILDKELKSKNIVRAKDWLELEKLIG